MIQWLYISSNSLDIVALTCKYDIHVTLTNDIIVVQSKLYSLGTWCASLVCLISLLLLFLTSYPGLVHKLIEWCLCMAHRSVYESEGNSPTCNGEFTDDFASTCINAYMYIYPPDSGINQKHT